jgi:hypothetical protein
VTNPVSLPSFLVYEGYSSSSRLLVILIRFLHDRSICLLHTSPVTHVITSDLPCPRRRHTKLHSKCSTLLVTEPKFLCSSNIVFWLEVPKYFSMNKNSNWGSVCRCSRVLGWRSNLLISCKPNSWCGLFLEKLVAAKIFMYLRCYMYI